MNAPVHAEGARHERVRLDVRGTVQGVGFRPFVYRRASTLGLAGWVTNTPEGVTVELEGPPESVAIFIREIRATPPPNAVIASITGTALPPDGTAGFEIRPSTLTGPPAASVLPDLATCEECLAETFDPANRRHRYPFTNCTRCGPRYSIVESLPYDRARTTMRAFAMCAACRAEYENPADRRFHAEPIACPACGPQLALWDAAGTLLAGRDDALLAAAQALREGRIVAVKGIGGFHLMVDARNKSAVRRLRERKHRPDKPLAVMFATTDAVAEAAHVSEAEAALLSSRERPIVLLHSRGGHFVPAVAPGSRLIGAMLPAMPLHHLLLAELGFPLVATSGNRSGEPIVTDEHDAPARLAGIAHLFLVHDRAIVRPLDDSVARIVADRPMLLRRARGYAPAPVAAAVEPGILALGGHLKAAIALTTTTGVVVSQHLGDLDTPEARDTWDTAVADLVRLHDTKPRLVVHDLHPDYHSTRAAARFGVRTIAVQHHVAHIAAVMAEHGLSPPLLGVAWDGTGYGPDGTVWGGEFIRITRDGWQRVARLRPFRLPGGEAAAREPRRAALGLLFAAFGEDAFAMTDLPPVTAFRPAERATLHIMLERGVNAPVTTSAGRLFDAVAALVGLRQRTTYEGQAAAELEQAAEATETAYAFAVRQGADGGPLLVDWQPALVALLADVRAGMPAGAMAAAFHAGLAGAIAEVAARVGESTVVLAGGCFQNARLTEAAAAALTAAGMRPVWPERVPPNDGGLALGQAWWAARTSGDA
ncbi:MAG: carbamoyltransferase HypF [Bauldia sp.]